MDTAVEEKVTNMEPGDCALTKSEIALEASEENIYEPGPSNSGTPEPDLVISDSEVAKNSVNEKSKCNTVDDRNDCIYHIKWISRNGIKTPIITQNENGPCPLIAIINVLIMKGRINMPLLIDIVTTEKLMEYLGDCILDSIPKNIPEGAQLNYEQNMHDAMAVLPKLQTGLDVNVRFTGISDFEYTPECIIFDLLRIPLYHGWLIDPQMDDVMKAVCACSYNQLVEKIINLKSSLDPDKVTDALVAENFLLKTASQLTYHGLYELTSKLKEGELCVLFRNNHFSSLIKHKNCLYQLVTDQGFLNENVVWETLNNVEGDAEFVDSNFVLVPPKASDVPLPPNVTQEQQIDQDYLVALSLQEEHQKQQNSELEWEDYKKEKLGNTNGLTDEELALRLQREEMRAQDNQRNQPKSSPPATRNKSRDPEDTAEMQFKILCMFIICALLICVFYGNA